jgi:hypothetical protein
LLDGFIRIRILNHRNSTSVNHVVWAHTTCTSRALTGDTRSGSCANFWLLCQANCGQGRIFVVLVLPDWRRDGAWNGNRIPTLAVLWSAWSYPKSLLKTTRLHGFLRIHEEAFLFRGTNHSSSFQAAQQTRAPTNSSASDPAELKRRAPEQSQYSPLYQTRLCSPSVVACQRRQHP